MDQNEPQANKPAGPDPFLNLDSGTLPVAPAPRPKLRRGFACMSREKNREIASKGGLKSQATGRAHKWTSHTGRIAAMISQSNRTAHKWTSQEAVVSGRKGGLARARNAKIYTDQPVITSNMVPNMNCPFNAGEDADL